MAHQHSETVTGTNKALDHMTELKGAVRMNQDFQKLLTEAESTYVKGGPGGCHAYCEATWKLYGTNGFVEIKVAHAHDSGSKAETHVTCVSPAFDSERRKRTFSGDVPNASAVADITAVVAEWLTIITKPNANQFSDASLPKVP